MSDAVQRTTLVALMVDVIVLACAIAGVWLLRHAAIRYAAQQRKLGRWDDEGPLVETEGPPRTPGPEGGNMNERLEITGRWRGRVIKDRRGEHRRADRGDSST